MTVAGRLVDDAVAAAEEVRRVPYRWPVPPDAASVRASGAGSCASKHALLAELLEGFGIPSVPLLVVGPLVPSVLAGDAAFTEGRHLLEVHELLTVATPWAGPLRVDVTWDPPLVARGLTGARWDGETDTPIAVDAHGPGWAVARPDLRAAKEALRARLYSDGDRQQRDRLLAAMSERFGAWRAG